MILQAAAIRHFSSLHACLYRPGIILEVKRFAVIYGRQFRGCTLLHYDEIDKLYVVNLIIHYNPLIPHWITQYT